VPLLPTEPIDAKATSPFLYTPDDQEVFLLPSSEVVASFLSPQGFLSFSGLADIEIK